MLEMAFSKNQRAVQLLARDLLCRDVGARLPTSLQYQELLGVGSGTVQKGLRVLESVGGVGLRARGHQGTFLVAREIGRLWAIAGLGAVTGAMPLPDSPEGSGLAAGLRAEFDLLGVQLQMLYLPGTLRRLEMVRQGRADFAILTRGTIESEHENDLIGHWIELDLGPHSYYSSGSMVVLMNSRAAEAGDAAIHTVGVDRGSHAHTKLTLAEFPESVGYHYESEVCPRLPAAIAEGRIDAAIWHRTVLRFPIELAGIRVRPLQERQTLDLLESLGRAVLVARNDKRELDAVVCKLDVGRLRDMQERVVRDEIPAIY
jgi:hypothetical protein